MLKGSICKHVIQTRVAMRGGGGGSKNNNTYPKIKEHCRFTTQTKNNSITTKRPERGRVQTKAINFVTKCSQKER